MPLPNPSYIDQEARHRASVIRGVNFQAMEGMEGVLLSDHLRVIPLSTPGAGISCNPGVYAINCKHQGGSFESYFGKVNSSLEFGPNGDGVVSVSPTSSAGSRTDLVILRVENPYVVGAGVWSNPPDLQNGPYAHVRVIENVPANTNNVIAVNSTWSAITLARITRPANTGIVQASHITDLRSLANPGGQRVIIIENPPPDPPPIANQTFIDSRAFGNTTAFPYNQTNFTDWPSGGSFQVPIPSWAVEGDFHGMFNPSYDEDIWGEMRLLAVDGSSTYTIATITYDENVSVKQRYPGPQQFVIPIGGEWAVPAPIRGKVVTIKTQFRSLNPSIHSGKLETRSGVYMNLLIDFKRVPN